MMTQRIKSARTRVLFLTLFCTSVAAGGAARAAEGRFQALSGTWAGSGYTAMKDGFQERLRCRARYQVGSGGESFSLDMTCASDSVSLNVVTNVTASGARINGVWSETTRGVGGNVSGRADARQISAVLDGAGFDAGISIATRGSRQTVVIRPSAMDVTEISISMSRH